MLNTSYHFIYVKFCIIIKSTRLFFLSYLSKIKRYMYIANNNINDRKDRTIKITCDLGGDKKRLIIMEYE